MGWAVYALLKRIIKSVNCSNPVYTSIPWVDIKFISYELIFCNLLYKKICFIFKNDINLFKNQT